MIHSLGREAMPTTTIPRRVRATLEPSPPPPRGERPSGAPLEARSVDGLLIPGRPQSRQDTRTGRDWKRDTRELATAHLQQLGLPVHATGLVRLDVHLYYALPTGASLELESMPDRWHEHSIPHAGTAADLLLHALTGVLYASVGQVSPLLVTRYVMPAHALEARFGIACRHGCALIRYGEASP